ncbi:LysE family transporter [Shewanella sp. JM162201]|uniref:LysE family transporter n=1 Tax=Shewanella jiangmenensis TaxID=2837387 RepID=A0ABS5V9K3_9GAMM|nr:LysE family transporter [Shewanella jiangmenensis]MBT1445708.1 LysE family transporter [Shewanella jiangmenensis]
MLDWNLLASIALVHLVALASPGPDFAIMLKVTREQTRTAALMTALGIALAILLHTLASLTGLSLLIHTTPWLFIAVQALGALYLGYMGVGALMAVKQHFAARSAASAELVSESGVEGATDPDEREAKSLSTIKAHSTIKVLSPINALKLGLYTNLLNPKALVFFLTLFSALVGPEVNIETRSALLFLMFALSFGWFGLLAMVLTASKAQQLMTRIGPAIDLLVGVLFVTVSIAILQSLLLG